ncbi:glycosyl hydrolase family 28-related protein [Rhodocista pekingensis]|uniref:Glycosyl hydrolase family 28-related protein n=1 Tax=Rhodocista pekingensis TaxID=201185 RepID=A0ABW2KVS8_9PROT
MATQVSITDFGARGDGRSDNKVAIQKALDHAKATGQTVYVPEGTFLHKGMLHADGVDLVGAGARSVLKAVGASSSFDDQTVRLSGSGGSIRNLTLDSDATARGYTGDSTKIWVTGARDWVIDNVTINNSFGAGILVGYGASDGRISNNTVRSTNADSIHISQASHDIVVSGNRVSGGGDDGIAVVSYMRNGAPVRDITITGNTVTDNLWGRNITVVGGENVTIRDNHVEGNKAGRAGIYLASEPAYDTFGVRNVTVEKNHVENVGGWNTGQGAITLFSGTGRMLEDIVIRGNGIVDAVKDGILLRGRAIDDVRLENNLIESPGNKPVVILDRTGDVVQSGNVGSRGAWKGSAGPQDSGPLDSSPATGVPAPDVRPVVPVRDKAPDPTHGGDPADGGGATVKVYAAGNSYKGDAEFRLLADGKQVGEVQDVTTQRGTGWQVFTFDLADGDLGDGDLADGGLPDRLSIEYANDLYGGPGKDRNLEIDRIEIDGTMIDPGRAGQMFGNGILHVDLEAIGLVGVDAAA